jgi:glucokinase
MQEKFVVSIDMGGTKILASVINSKQGIIAREKMSTEIGKSAKNYMKDIALLTEKVIDKSGLKKNQIASVCLGIPGSVNPYEGTIGIAPNLGIKNFNVKTNLENMIKYNILIENDVNLAAMGIKEFGVGKNAKNMLVVAIGTGIGGGIIINEKIYRGSNYIAGEIGHFVIDEKGPLCGCGKKGCFEALASRTAIVRNIINDVKKLKKKSLLEKQIKSGERIKSKALLNAYENNDKVVIRRINESAEIVGKTLGSINNLMNFDLIVLAGGLIEAVGKYYLPIVKSAFRHTSLNENVKNTKIVLSKLLDDAAIYGGISLTREFLGISV